MAATRSTAGYLTGPGRASSLPSAGPRRAAFQGAGLALGAFLQLVT